MDPNTQNNAPNTLSMPDSQPVNQAEALPVIPSEIASPLPVESRPAVQEVKTGSNESVNQNAGMPLPAVVAPVDDNQTAVPAADPVPPQPQASNVNPATADDVDIVEKEWVDRARKIVEQTRDNPYLQEQEVEKLQIDYLKKRYGKEIKPSEAHS